MSLMYNHESTRDVGQNGYNMLSMRDALDSKKNVSQRKIVYDQTQQSEEEYNTTLHLDFSTGLSGLNQEIFEQGINKDNLPRIFERGRSKSFLVTRY